LPTSVGGASSELLRDKGGQDGMSIRTAIGVGDNIKCRSFLFPW
jgi:hypothetical protein